MSDDVTDPAEELPGVAGVFADEHAEVWDAYAELGRASSEAGPIDDETKRLVKLALAIGADSEGAVHSHVRRARDEGIPDETIEQIAILSITTLGFPRAMAALSWIRDLTTKEAED